MAKNTAIEWATHTWNPWIGCHKVSSGCLNCYAERDSLRFGWKFTDIHTTKYAAFTLPLRIKEPGAVFTCSWSDFFLPEADEWRPKVWEIIAATPHLTYLILTKRPEFIRPDFDDARLPHDWGSGYPNVWLGTSVETQKHADLRIPILAAVPAVMRFLSCEPLLGPLDIRKWLGYNPVDAIEEQGRCPACGGTRRMDQGAIGRLNLADGPTEEEPLGRRDHDASGHAPSNRRRGRSGLSQRQDNGGREADLRARSSARMEDAHGADSSGSDDQPQERGEGRQQARELGTGDIRRAGAPRSQDSSRRTDAEAERCGQPHGETQCGCGQGDSSSQSSGGTTPGTRVGVRRLGQDDLEDRPPGTMGISWLIAGGESDLVAPRPADLNWFRSLRDQCKNAGLPFFLKQIGGRRKIDGSWGGNRLDGELHQAMPPMSMAGTLGL